MQGSAVTLGAVSLISAGKPMPGDAAKSGDQAPADAGPGPQREP
jgi:hypothetical protein